ncbi:MAG: N-acetyltransferase [Candidatus Omnitrophica bacterium]|nr:N-acetyltransferase [Candidatus Omnitrophota bacterium]
MTPGTHVLHDEVGHRFYLPLENGGEALLQYRQEGNVLDFYHTYVPEEARTKGLAEMVVEAGFRYAQEHHLKVIPTCPYVSAAFLRKRKEFLPFVIPAKAGI